MTTSLSTISASVTTLHQAAGTQGSLGGINGLLRSLYRRFISHRETEATPPSRSIENPWGMHANCYAYAMNCPEPVYGQNGGAKPGALLGAAVNAHGDTQVYKDALIVGANLDGATPVEGGLRSIPEPVEGTYLVALLSNGSGFHWLRRNETTRTWSWKDGNGGTVKHNVYALEAGRHVSIQDGTAHNLTTLLGGTTTYMGWLYSNMQFVSFFKVPNQGCRVSGQAPAQPL